MAATSLGTLVTYNPWAVGPTALLDDIAARFAELQVHHVPVVDSQRQIIGMLSETDLLRARQSKRTVLVGAGLSDTGDAPPVFARDCMSREVYSISPGADFAAALSLLLDRQIHALPVVEQGRLIGMVSSRDFLREFSYGEMPGGARLCRVCCRRIGRSTLAADATLDEALMAMQEWGASCLVVCQGECPLGIVSQRDIVREKCRLDEADDDLGLRAAANVLQVARISPPIRGNQRLFEAASAMVENGLPAVIVVSPANCLLGLVTEDDLMRVLYDAQA